MRLTKNNYYSQKANKAFMSVSQFKTFKECPARAMAEINGEWQREPTIALLQGQYLDAHFDGDMSEFQAEHPEMFKRDGTLKAEFVKADEAIKIIESDEVMLQLYTGKRQKIFTGVIAGVPFKVRIDSLLKDRIVDNKYMANFNDVWKNGEYMTWWKAYDYQFQGAIYKEIYRQNKGVRLPFELVGISKEPVPDKAWVRFSDQYLDTVLDEVKTLAPIFQSIKDGLMDADGCGVCDYCRSKKMLTKPEII